MQPVPVQRLSLFSAIMEKYGCTGFQEDGATAHLFELDYAIRSHRWRLRRRVY